MAFINVGRRRMTLLVCLAICGCNKPGAPGIAALPVTGKVTLDGKPLAGASVMFTTVETASFAGTTQEDGSYQLLGIAGRNAACKGKCQVIVSRYLKPDGSPVGPDEPPALSFATESLPERYSMPSKSELSVDVPEEGGAFDFDLKSD